jgi:hypothetical protein
VRQRDQPYRDRWQRPVAEGEILRPVPGPGLVAEEVG